MTSVMVNCEECGSTWFLDNLDCVEHTDLIKENTGKELSLADANELKEFLESKGWA